MASCLCSGVNSLNDAGKLCSCCLVVSISSLSSADNNDRLSSNDAVGRDALFIDDCIVEDPSWGCCCGDIVWTFISGTNLSSIMLKGRRMI